MRKLAPALVTLLALEHVYIMIVEMFLWNKPYGQRVFQQAPDVAATSATLAANQGLYNGFLAAGLAWGLFRRDEASAFSIRIFFVVCVLIAGIFGGATALPKIFWVQALPAALTLGALLLSRTRSRNPSALTS